MTELLVATTAWHVFSHVVFPSCMFISDIGVGCCSRKAWTPGFQLAEKLLPKFNAFIMHDVDLLPSEDMRQVYGRPPPDGYAVHLASVWESLDLK